MPKRDIISEINTSFREKCTTNLSLMTIIEDSLKKLGESPATPTDYYYVTDLTNPQQKFWKTMSPHVKKSNDLTRRLIMGNRLQTKFTNWCKTLPNFMVEEGMLDGAYVGIPKVKGRVDYVIDNSIIELKTKEAIPKTIEEIFEKYPNDLEQLVFYSALHPAKPIKNILLFMESKKPYSITAFEIITKNFDAVKSIINERIKLLDETLGSKMADKAFKKLGKCRYYDGGCEFHESGACNCDKLAPLDLSKLKESIEIRPAIEFTKQLEQKRKEFENASSVDIYPNNIIAPRQHFIKNILELERDFLGSGDKFVSQTCLSSAIYKTGLTQFDPQKKEELQKKTFDKRLTIPFKWLRLPSSSTSTNETIMPYITAVSDYDKVAGYPTKYHVADLGIICASQNVSKGAIITISPKLNKAITVYEVQFKASEIKKTQETIRAVINEIESAQKEEDLHMLHACPDYMANECPIKEKCKQTGDFCLK